MDGGNDDKFTQPIGGSLEASVVVVQPTCHGQSNVSVTAVGGGGDYSYSLNGGPFQSSSIFLGVAPGLNQVITTRAYYGCNVTTSFNVSGYYTLDISAPYNEHTYCADRKGYFCVNVTTNVVVSTRV